MLDAIAPNRTRYAGMSDQQRDREYKAQERLAKAVFEMEKAIEAVNENSALESVNVSAWQDFMHDEIPCTRQWNERIERARNP